MYEVLMCEPKHFDVVYSINPWMDTNIKCDKNLAQAQWNNLYTTYTTQIGMKVQIIDQDKNLPDMVFTANGGFVHNRKAIPGTFKHKERQQETVLFKNWFLNNGYQVFDIEGNITFEGSGDAIPYKDTVFAGYYMRSDREAHDFISKTMDMEVVPFKLEKPSFYHIDTVFFPLKHGYVIYYPEAFDEAGQQILQHRVGHKKLIPVDDAEANIFACNAINVDDTVVINKLPNPRLENILKEKGFKVLQVDLSEFMKAGGSAKCMTLELDN